MAIQQAYHCEKCNFLANCQGEELNHGSVDFHEAFFCKPDEKHIKCNGSKHDWRIVGKIKED